MYSNINQFLVWESCPSVRVPPDTAVVPEMAVTTVVVTLGSPFSSFLQEQIQFSNKSNPTILSICSSGKNVAWFIYVM